MDTAKRLEGIGEYYFSKKLREIEDLNRDGKNIISLGIGSPDQAPHPDVIRILQEESSKPTTHAYQSYKGSPVLRKAMAAWYKEWYQVELNPDLEILPLAGSKEGIMHICMSYINPGDLVLIPDPGYPTYQSAAKLAGAHLAAYQLKEENGWLPDFSELKDLMKLKQGKQESVLMFVNYPQMPTGQLPSKKLFEELVTFAKENQVLLLNNDDVAKVLDMSMCLKALDDVFHELARGEAVGMGRIDVYVPSEVETAPYYRWAVMTGGSKKDGLVCARMLSDMVAWPREYGRIRENKYAQNPGTFCGLLFLFSARDATLAPGNFSAPR